MVYVKDEGRFYTVYKRANGTNYIVKNGKRKTIRKDKKRYRTKIACSTAQRSPCRRSKHCSWTVGKGCRAKGLPVRVAAQKKMQEVLGLVPVADSVKYHDDADSDEEVSLIEVGDQESDDEVSMVSDDDQERIPESDEEVSLIEVGDQESADSDEEVSLIKVGDQESVASDEEVSMVSVDEPKVNEFQVDPAMTNVNPQLFDLLTALPTSGRL